MRVFNRVTLILLSPVLEPRMSESVSSKYEFETLLSQNDLCQSWLATSAATGEKCFVKVNYEKSPVDERVSTNILKKSYELQHRLNCDRVITARRKQFSRGRLYIEYPLLSSEWQQLTPEIFWQDFDGVFVQMCLLVDLLHLYELVHCDLKLSNFLINLTGSRSRLVLADLDFLSEAGSSPGARIFGTPRHIAPEIIANDTVVAQSDNFSLGVAIGICLEQLDRQTTPESLVPEASITKLRDLCQLLTADDPLHRPYAMLEALARVGLLDEEQLTKVSKTLLSHQMLGTLRGIRTGRGAGVKNLRKSFVEDNRVLGVRNEVIDDIIRVFNDTRRTGIRLARMVIDQSRISRFGDYWSLEFSDEDMMAITDTVDETLGRPVREDRLSDLKRGREVSEILNLIRQHKEAGNYLNAYFDLAAMWSELNNHDGVSGEDKVRLLRELTYLCEYLHRPEDAAGFYELLASIDKSRGDEYFSTLRQYLALVYELGDYVKVRELADRGCAEAEAHGNQVEKLLMVCYNAQLSAIENDFDKAERLLESVFENLSDTKPLVDVWIRAYYARGITAWLRGQTWQAYDYSLKGFEVARKNLRFSNSIGLLYFLANLSRDVGRYEMSAEYGRIAINHVEAPKDRSLVPLVSDSLAMAYARLADHKKADYWSVRSITEGGSGVFRSRFVSHYTGAGYIKIISGDLGQAKQFLYKALDMVDSRVRRNSILKIYQNLAEIALVQGQPDKCDNYLSEGQKVLADQSDHASLLDLKLIGLLNQIYNRGESHRVKDLLPLTKSLIDGGSIYFAGLGIFHSLMNPVGIDRQGVLETAGRLMDMLRESGAPFFKVLAAIVDAESEAKPDGLGSIRVLKEVYRSLDAIGDKFLTLVVCSRLAELYLAGGHTKLGRKFLRQALKFAQSLGNEIETAEITAQLETTHTAGDQAGLIESVLGVSEVLKNITDYARSLEQTVTFAVEQTGAERGVLLLKAEQSGELQVAALVNCDEDCLEDIVDFSSNIPLDVARNVSPLVIDNALTDKRTRDYKSIIIHNILSVICIPITLDDKVLGVLYLDHHTIPALFEKDDITYVTSIANLMAVMIAAIRSYRDMSLINQQLVEDVGRQGGRQTFVTRDSSMGELFGKLPEIARTNAPVLIAGESGTGKEILCEMIHRLSLRADKPLIKLNCAAIAGTLIESELFGVAAHVATDVREREGKFSAADGGTLLLDEIGDMPLEIQAKVLRAVEYQQFEKVGSNKTMHTDIRFIYATNRNLAEMVKNGQFRQDLFYRINTVTIEIPPLRERHDDILLLLDHFVALYSRSSRPPRFTPQAMEALVAYSWPGNVRELKNLAERCCIIYAGDTVDLASLPAEITSGGPTAGDDKRAFQTLEKEKIKRALIEHGWNQSRASSALGIPLTTLRRKIKKYKISKLV